MLTALAQTVPLAKTMDEQINRLRSWAEGRARNASVARDGHQPSPCGAWNCEAAEFAGRRVTVCAGPGLCL